jgi:hypothetical protein
MTMTIDDTIRSIMCEAINSGPPATREIFESNGIDCYDTEQLQETFDVISFLAPYVSVVRKSDNVKGILTFQHNPRIYWGFEESKV